MTIKDTLLAGLVLSVLIALLAAAGTSDATVAAEDSRLYCEMTNQWRTEAAQGIPPSERAGWPPSQEGYCDE